jgi:hypothetical protein
MTPPEPFVCLRRRNERKDHGNACGDPCQQAIHISTEGMEHLTEKL